MSDATLRMVHTIRGLIPGEKYDFNGAMRCVIGEQVAWTGDWQTGEVVAILSSAILSNINYYLTQLETNVCIDINHFRNLFSDDHAHET